MRQLTARQLQVVNLMALGWSNKEIALHLETSEQTIKNHNTGIYNRLGVANRTQAVVLTAARGQINLYKAAKHIIEEKYQRDWLSSEAS